MTAFSLPNSLLTQIAREYGTPAYVYDLNHIRARTLALREATDREFKISYAMKSNPNPTLVNRMREIADRLDVSSGGELTRAIDRGWPAHLISFTGPGKRDPELKLAVDCSMGHVVLESIAEAERLNAIASQASRIQSVLIRISPLTLPPGFGSRMAGKPTQFGIDEEVIDDAISKIVGMKHLRLNGFHVYSGTQCLNAKAIVAHFRATLDLFARVVTRHTLQPKTLIVGSGFGIPYHESDLPLDLRALGAELAALSRTFRSMPAMNGGALIIESGRFLVGEAGCLLTSVVATKQSRGVSIAICDAGMNHHLAAAGHLGSVIHRNYPIFKVADVPPSRESWQPQTLYGPLCTSIDLLANQLPLPPLHAGDLLAIVSSGAYGLSASPIHFIGHPIAREILVEDQALIEASSSASI